MHGRVFVALILLCAASFAGASSMSLSSKLDAAGNSDMNAKIVFDGYFGKQVSMYLSGGVGAAAATDASGLALPVSVSQEGNYTKISVDVPTDYAEFAVSSPYFTSKSGAAWKYESTIRASEDIRNFSAVLYLPDGAKVTSSNGEVASEGGGLALHWKADDFNTTEKATMRATYVLEPEQTNVSLPVALAGLFALGVLIYLHLTRRKKPEPMPAAVPKAEAGPAPVSGTPAFPQPPLPAEGDSAKRLESNPVFKTLDENDREIMREIVRQGGKTTQAQLYLYTHIPKATLSRRLASLESKGIIAKSQKGNRNLVTLGDALTK